MKETDSTEKITNEEMDHIKNMKFKVLCVRCRKLFSFDTLSERDLHKGYLCKDCLLDTGGV